MTGIMIDRATVRADFKLPHDLDVETQIIGLVLMATKKEQNPMWRDFCHLSPEDFFDPLNQMIWRSVHRLHEAGSRVDFATVFGETAALYGGAEDRESLQIKQYMAGCVAGIVTTVNNRHYAMLLREMADKRATINSLMDHAHRTSTSGFITPASELAGAAICDLQANVSHRSDLVGATSIIDEIEEDLDAPVKATPTGLPRLDAALRGGFHEGRFYGLLADQKAGKTTMLAPTVSYNMALAGEPHVYLCLEMKPKEIFQRYLCRWMGEQTGMDINTDIFFDRRQTDQKWFRELLREAVSIFDEKKTGLKFLRRPRMPLDELRSTLARIGLSGEYKGVIIDYMQLVGGSGRTENQTQHLDNVAQTIAEFCSDHPIWVCAAAQMNQDGTVRGGKGLNAACDMLLALHKMEFDGLGEQPAYYKAWIEMMATRYTPTTHIGSEESPAYDFNIGAGPSYKELPRPTIPDFAKGLRKTDQPEPKQQRWRQ